jgi:hypothetical protein
MRDRNAACQMTGAVLLLLVLGLALTPVRGATQSDATPPELVALAQEFRSFRSPSSAAVPDYGARDAELRQRLPEFRSRLEAIDPRSWPVSAQVDYLVLKIEMNALDFDLNVVQQVSRNPDYYVNQAANRVTRHIGGRYQVGPNAIPVPYDAQRARAIVAALNETPEILRQAPRLLTQAVPEMADMTIERLANIRGAYEEFATVVSEHVPSRERSGLQRAARRAADAMEEYREWLVANRAGMSGSVTLGREPIEWYIQHVMVIPYTVDELLTQAESERIRNWAFLQLERQRNRSLPRPGSITDVPARSAASNEEFADWKDATDVMTRVWLEQHALLNVPDYVGPIRQESTSRTAAYIQPFGFMGFPTEQLPEGHKVKFVLEPDHVFETNYWNTGHRIDPGVNHPHSDIPGHTFEGMVTRATTRDFRRGHNTRGDALAYYWEDVQLQTDYPFVRGATIREWMYGLAIMRAERVFVAARLADGTYAPEDVTRHMMENVPWMEPYVAKYHETWRLYSRPAYVFTYQVGKFELMKLMRDRMMQLGDAFDIREFHDHVMATGMIPIALARWELAGIDDDIQHLWDTPPIPRIGGGRADTNDSEAHRGSVARSDLR